MSETFMPDEAAPPQGLPPAAPMPPELATAMGGGPGGADTALPPELAAALGGGPEGAPPGGEPPLEPASMEAAMEHIRMGMQMLQELQVGSEDDMEMAELGGIMGPVQKMLADRQKKDIVKSASG